MADENEKPTLDPQPRRRVPPPTIDLEATDVSPPNPDAAAGAAASAPSDDAPSGAPSPPPEPRPRERAAKAAPPRSGPPRWTAGLAAGAVGAVLALVVVGAAWFLLGGGPDGTAEMNARLARAEGQLATLPPQPGGADAKTLADLTRRIGELETARATPATSAAPSGTAPSDAALADLDRRLDAATAAARAAQQRADAAAQTAAKAATDAKSAAEKADAAPAAQPRADAADRADLDALAARVAGLESANRSLADQLAKAQANIEAKIASQSVAATAVASAAAAAPAEARDAVAALALELAVARGAPYARELAAVDPADARTRDALSPFAATGVPSAPALAHELATLIPAARAAVTPASNADLLDRLGVHVRPIGTPAGDTPTEVLARLETAAAHADLAAARADAAKLPDAARAALDPWSKRAAAREAALTAAAALVGKALDAMHGAPTR